MTRRTGLERGAYWQEVIRQQESSGLSIAAFCREREVAEGSFFYWRGKLKSGSSQKEAAEGEQEPQRSRPRQHAVERFVPVEIPTASSTREAKCEVVLPNGCRVIVPTHCDARWLGEILGVLGEQGC